MPTVSNWIRQAGVVPVLGDQVCMVTSSSGRRWVLPKGCQERGMSLGETGLQEAWEEAGLAGTLQPEPVGTFLYSKYGKTCHVTMFWMDVSNVAEQWPEKRLRQRAWVTPTQALLRIEEPGLRDILRIIESRFHATA